MPIYEYGCNKCGVVEVMQRITEAPLKKCPKCKGKVERLLSRSSFVLKGSGWYQSDYARKGTPSDTASESASSSSNGTATSTPATESSSKPKPAAAEKPAASKSAD